MLSTTNVKVYRHPVFFCLFRAELLFVFRIKVAKVVPAASAPLRHCVCFPLCIGTALRALAVYPRIDCSKRAFTCTCWLVTLYFRELERKFFFRYRYRAAVRAVYQRDRFAPVALSAEYPVTELVVDCLAADFLFFKEFKHFCNCISFIQSVKEF